MDDNQHQANLKSRAEDVKRKALRLVQLSLELSQDREKIGTVSRDHKRMVDLLNACINAVEAAKADYDVALELLAMQSLSDWGADAIPERFMDIVHELRGRPPMTFAEAFADFPAWLHEAT
jgi:hypothetical protein